MTDAPVLALVPMDATEQIRRAVEAGNALYTGEAVWQKALAASPFIDGVPVDVVEQCAANLYAEQMVCPAEGYKNLSEPNKEQWRDLVRTVLLAAGLKVADNG